MSKAIRNGILGIVLVGMMVTLPGEARAWEDFFEQAPWTLSAGGSYTRREGDEPVKNSYSLTLRVGYDFNPRWTFEVETDIMPKLENRSWESQKKFQIDDDTWGVRTGFNAMFHLRSIDNLRFDPYLSGGLGLTYYGEDLGDGNLVPSLPAGLGLFYHFSDAWAARVDARYEFISIETGRIAMENHFILSLGVNYRFGTGVPARYEVVGGAIDSDGDGLLDDMEAQIGTDPYDPDTDDDGLMDGEEVNVYSTDPLNEDTDWDALKDGAEVHTYSTNPLEADTDNGGVADGHEVIEDLTDPLNPADDLQLYTLDIEFDYDKANLRPQYYEDLDVIVKVLQRDPGATAKVEGHADKRPKSSRKYNLRLSDRRAKAVVEYLIDIGGIDASRLSYEGFGFDRPIAPNDTEENMQKNRRTEVYIRPSADSLETPVLMETREPVEFVEEAVIVEEYQEEEPPVK